MSDALGRIARLRAEEAAVEGGLPFTVMAAGWWQFYARLGEPAHGRPFGRLELCVVVGACAALVGWAVGRQLFLMGKRRLPTLLWPAVGLAIILLFSVSALIDGRFEARCESALSGTMVEVSSFLGGADLPACRIAGVPGNPYLPGTLIYAGWDGAFDALLYAVAALSAGASSLAFRDWRLFATSVPRRLFDALWLSPASGSSSSFGGLSKDGRVMACANPTLWGEPCGQLYPADKQWEAGAWCVRCQQTFRKAERHLHFQIVSLFSGDLDVLNGLERLDTVAWNQGDRISPDARISAVERWVTLGSIDLPDVLSVSQALALVYERLPKLAEKGDDRVKAAVALAVERGSRLSAWIWFGRMVSRLTFARPTSRAIFALATRRLRDLVASSGEDLTLQLDIGLLPVELRAASRRTFLEEGRAPVLQNSKVDMWVPVGPPGRTNASPGLWVPRIDGEALRLWLSVDRRSGTDARGQAIPVAYVPYGSPIPERVDLERRLDLILLDHEGGEGEIELRRDPGDSIAEWEWFDGLQIELVRQRVLVLIDEEDA